MPDAIFQGVKGREGFWRRDLVMVANVIGTLSSRAFYRVITIGFVGFLVFHVNCYFALQHSREISRDHHPAAIDISSHPSPGYSVS